MNGRHIQPRNRMNKILLTLLASALGVAAAPGVNWPNWRGPNHDGSSPETALPAVFSPTEKVKWVTDLPGPSAATPVVWNDRVFVSSTDAATKKLKAFCLERATGRVLWQKDIADAFGRDERSNFASPSPVTDGKRVYFYYGTGDLLALDMDGSKVWARNIQKDYGTFAFLWTYSTSPLLHNGTLYIQVLQRDTPVDRTRPLATTEGNKPIESYLLALDAADGKEQWRQVRPCDAKVESRESFASPVPSAIGQREEILITGGDCITGHDPKTGRELWRWGTWNPTHIGHWRLVPSPVSGGGVVLACAPKGAPVFAFKAGQSGALDAEKGFAWKSEQREVSTDVSTPLFYKGRFYVLNSDRRVLSCVEPSGKILWTGELGGRAKFEASPTGADGKIYMMNHGGEVHVVAAGDTFKKIHVAAMGGDDDRDLRSAVAVAHGQLFIRTGTKLWCVGN